jgi:hypothetical protein
MWREIRRWLLLFLRLKASLLMIFLVLLKTNKLFWSIYLMSETGFTSTVSGFVTWFILLPRTTSSHSLNWLWLSERRSLRQTRINLFRCALNLPKHFILAWASAVTLLILNINIASNGRAGNLVKESSKRKRTKEELEEVKDEEEQLKEDRQSFLKSVKKLKKDKEDLEGMLNQL